jgi:hypothetical protein
VGDAASGAPHGAQRTASLARAMDETIMSYDIKVEDVEYIHHGGTPLLARLYRPGA